MSNQRAIDSLAIAFLASLPPAISAAINSSHVHQAMAEAEPNGWSASELLSVSVNDTRGLQPGPAAAKVLSQLRYYAGIRGPNKSSGPLHIDELRAQLNSNHQPAKEPSQWATRIRRGLRGETA